MKVEVAIVAKKREVDDNLLRALTAAYTARARLFHQGVISSNIDLLVAEIGQFSNEGLNWDLGDYTSPHCQDH